MPTGLRLGLRIVASAAMAVVCNVYALSIDLLPTSVTKPVGSFVTFDLVASDFTPQIVSTYDVDLTFDPSILQYTSATSGNSLGTGADFLATGGLGSVNLFELAFDLDAALEAAQGSGPLTLAHITFRGIAAGTSMLQLSFNALGGRTDSTTFVTDNLLLGGPTIGSAAATIEPRAALPEPGTLLMLATGTLLLGFASRRKNN